MFFKNSILTSRFFMEQYLSRGYFISRQFPHITQLLNVRKSYLHYSFSKFGKTNDSNGDSTLDALSSEISEEYQELYNRVFHLPEMGHQVLVIQPYIKWGQMKLKTTTPKLKLEEATSLINTLPNWKVVNQMTIGLSNFSKFELFGKGNLEMIRDLIAKNNKITAIFISINSLKSIQQVELQKIFGIPIYDRYMIVMQIFQQHAISQEAKLQVQLAELSYLWSRISESSLSNIGGMGETYLELRKQILGEREKKLKKAIAILRERRTILRAKRHKMDFPVIAVVGYTNAGKTSLIQSLTGSQKLIPKDKLFATLDVTLHAGLLPSRMKVLYVDTIGFFSDIPTTLIESFTSTLEDAMLADVIIHVRDISHPDTSHQSDEVLNTLQSLDLRPELLDNMITVGNKIDKVNDADKYNSNISLISTVTNEGLNELLFKIEQIVFKVCNKMQIKIRVPSGGDESRWLFKEAVVLNQEPDPNNSQYMFLNVIISKITLNKFKQYFVKINR